ncbi:hypothetical protein KEM52_001041 [Ascosphaera acerosa]|nr:hypothetical protein KEM52_001041 [Ascosphaera acerosa]
MASAAVGVPGVSASVAQVVEHGMDTLVNASTVAAGAAATATSTVTAATTPLSVSSLLDDAYAFVTEHVARTVTRMVMLPLYLVYQAEVYALSTLPRWLLRDSGLLWAARAVKNVGRWLVNDFVQDVKFLTKLASTLVDKVTRHLPPGRGAAARHAVAEEDAGFFAELLRSGGMTTYFTSRWGLTCLVVVRSTISLTWR